MSSLFNSGVFSRAVFSGTIRQTSQKAASAASTGFAQIFTTMLAKQMRESMVGADHGPMGIGGGAAGDIYGSFIDEAMGKALAGSKSMKQLTSMIDRQLSGSRQTAISPLKKLGPNPIRLASNSVGKGIAMVSGQAASSGVSPVYTGVTMPSDKRGPILLPPTPPSASVLLPPPSEG
jgi:Rod binding domain-containing protein